MKVLVKRVRDLCQQTEPATEHDPETLNTLTTFSSNPFQHSLSCFFFQASNILISKTFFVVLYAFLVEFVTITTADKEPQ
jgi:hypothetical protein